MSALWAECPKGWGEGHGWTFELTRAGRLVWDCEKGTIERAKLVLVLVARGQALTPQHRRAAGVHAPHVRYASGYVGEPAERKLQKITQEERARPAYCMEKGIGKLLLRDMHPNVVR